MTQQINLFNPLFEPRREWISFNVAASVVLALIALVAIVGSLLDMRNASLATRERATAERMNQAKEEMTRLATQLGSRQKDPQLTAELAHAEAELKARDDVVALLEGGTLGNTLGYSEYLRAFARQSIDGLWLTRFHIAGAGNRVSIEGRTLRAELVPDYIQRLNREQIMQGRAFSEMQMQLPPREPGDKKVDAGFLEFKLATGPEVPANKGAQR